MDYKTISCIIEPEEKGKGGLFLGNLDSASDLITLIANRIKAVISIKTGPSLIYPIEFIEEHLKYFIEDHEDSYIYGILDECYEFIETNIINSRSVLVHCLAGVSRSASIIIAYLMKKNNWTYDKSKFEVQKKRTFISPNLGFVRQLRQYEKKLISQQS